jgi:hypothetical protein
MLVACEREKKIRNKKKIIGVREWIEYQESEVLRNSIKLAEG